MKKKYLIIGLLVIPLIVGGCFKKAAKEQPVVEVSYQIYTQQDVPWGGFKVKYPSTWQLVEEKTGKFPDYIDKIIFQVAAAEENQVTIFNYSEKDSILDDYVVESESQTQLDSRLASDYLVQDQSGQRYRLILVVSGDYLYLLSSNKPGSVNFDHFINNFSILETIAAPPAVNLPPLSPEVKVKIYFDDLTKQNDDCSADGFEELAVTRPEVEIGLIPLVMKLLIQRTLAPEELSQQQLASAIPINTRILSFGYENNTAIVNFNNELNADGQSCEMLMRQGQIQETLKSLNDISDLEIKNVEIQVDSEPLIIPE